MFSGFLGKGKKAESPPTKDAVNSRGPGNVKDDPDTTWGLWKSAVAEQDSRFTGLPSSKQTAQAPDAFARTVPMTLDFPDDDLRTPPVTTAVQSAEQRKDDALEIVATYHNRIANTIRTLWGYKECSEYISKLIMSGGDGMGNARVGFNPEAAHAMMLLADLHDAQFGSSQLNSGAGFADPSVRTGLDGLR